MDVKLRFTKAEEIANALSHGMGLLMAVAATVLMIMADGDDPWQCVSGAVFGAGLIMLYFSSLMNHSLGFGKAKDFFHNFDQIAIYVLIAATYTPLSLAVIRYQGGWIMFGIEWGLALTGILVKAFLPNSFQRGVNILIIISYIVMGWLVLFFLPPLIDMLSRTSMILIFTGGFFYSVGILFFKWERLKFSHLIWHIFVIGGSASHWTAVYLFILEH